MRKLFFALLPIVFFLLSPSVVFAESVTISPSVDTYLTTSGFADSSFDDAQSLLANYDLNTKNMGYILIKFPLNAIPAGATINSAKLFLYMYEASGTSPIKITAKVILDDWNSHVTLVNQPMWGEDITAVDVNSIKEYKIWDITSVVKKWKAGTTPNYGVYILKKSPQDFGFSRKFYSQNRGNANTNPKLVVSYTPKAGINLPSSNSFSVTIKPNITIAVPHVNLPQGGGAAQQNVTISEVKTSNITQTDALVSWKTNVGATSWVYFGIATNGDKFDQKVWQNDMVTSHALGLQYLTPNTKYSYKVMSKDGKGNEFYGPIQYFTTASFGGISPTSSAGNSASQSPTSGKQSENNGENAGAQAPSSPAAQNSTQSPQVQQNKIFPSYFLTMQSIGQNKIIGILLTLLGFMCIVGVALLYVLTKKSHRHGKKENQKDLGKKGKEEKEDD